MELRVCTLPTVTVYSVNTLPCDVSDTLYRDWAADWPLLVCISARYDRVCHALACSPPSASGGGSAEP